MDGPGRAEGRRVVREAQREDGTLEWEYEDGNAYVRRPDGETVHTAPDGRVTWHLNDGTVRFQSPDGSTGVTFRDGTTRSQTADGWIFVSRPDAETRIFDPSGHERSASSLADEREFEVAQVQERQQVAREGAKRGCTPPVIATIIAVVVALGGGALVVALTGDDEERAGGTGSASGIETTTTTEQEEEDGGDDEAEVDVSGVYEVDVTLVDSDVSGGTDCASGGEFEITVRGLAGGDLEFDAEGNVTEGTLEDDLSFEIVTEIDEDGAFGSFTFGGEFDVEGSRAGFEATEIQDLSFEDGSSTSCTNEYSGVRISGP